MNNLKLHSKIFKKMKALQAILDDIKDNCIKELKKQPENAAIVEGVEYHLTASVKKTITSKKYKAMNAELKELKEAELAAGHFKESETITFDSYIPKSTVDAILASASPEFKKHFAM